jgi:CheY-like chemotaxis protein
MRSATPARPTTQPDSVRTLVADDHETYRDMMRQLLSTAPGFTLAGEVPSGEAAIAAVDALHPQLVLMDVRMPGMGGLAAARALADLHPDVVVILMSAHRRGDAAGAPFVAKEQLNARRLRELWDLHRRSDA